MSVQHGREVGNPWSFQIYDDSLKVSAAKFGPLSKNVENTLRTIDRYIQNFLKRLRVAHMDKSVSEK